MLRFGFYTVLLMMIGIMVMFLRIRFEVRYRRKGQDDSLHIQVSALKGLVRYRTEVPVVELNHYLLSSVLKIETKTRGPLVDAAGKKDKVLKVPITLAQLRKIPFYIKKAGELLRRYQKAWRKLLSSLRFHHFAWTTEIGLGDPAGTGVAAGLLWGVKGFVYGVFQNYVGTVKRNPQLLVTPCFSGSCFRLDFHCIFDIRIGHIIIAGLKFVKLRFRQ